MPRLLAAALLTLVALGQLLRLVFCVEVVVGGVAVPLWASMLAFAATGAAAFLLWREMANRQPSDAADETSLADTGSWDLSQERMFIENLFCQRFNFFIVIYSLVIAGAATTNIQWKLTAILAIGFVLCLLVSLTIYRNYVKLIWILKTLHRNPQHPVAMAQTGIQSLGARRLFGVNSIIGIWIPVFCCITLLVGFVLSFRGALPAGK